MQVIVRRVGNNNWAGKTLYKNCVFCRGSYFTRSGARYTGLTPQEARELESKLGYPENHLAPTSDFWTIFTVKFTGSKDVVLNTDEPLDELKYRFLKNHKNVSTRIQDSNRPGIELIIINKDDEAKEQNSINNRKMKALNELYKMSPTDKKKLLVLYGINPDHLSDEMIDNTAFNAVDTDPTRFFSRWIENTTRDTEYLIEQAIGLNTIRRNKSVYKFGTDIIGTSLSEAIDYLDSPKQQDLKIAIMSEVDAKLETIKKSL